MWNDLRRGRGAAAFDDFVEVVDPKGKVFKMLGELERKSKNVSGYEEAIALSKEVDKLTGMLKDWKSQVGKIPSVLNAASDNDRVGIPAGISGAGMRWAQTRIAKDPAKAKRELDVAISEYIDRTELASKKIKQSLTNRALDDIEATIRDIERSFK